MEYGGRVEYSAQRSDEGWRKKGERRYTHIVTVKHNYN